MRGLLCPQMSEMLEGLCLFPTLVSNQQQDNSRGMSQVCFRISVKQFETLLSPCLVCVCVCMCVCVCGAHVCVRALFPHFSPPSDMSFKTNVRNFLPLPTPTPASQALCRKNRITQRSPHSLAVYLYRWKYTFYFVSSCL